MKATFGYWLKKSGYHQNFFIAVLGGLAAAMFLEAKGLSLSSLGDIIKLLVILVLVIIVYFMGAYFLYKFSPEDCPL